METLGESLDSFESTRPKQFHCMFFLQLTEIPAWLLARPILGYRIQLAPKVAWRAATSALTLAYSRTDIKEMDVARMVPVEIRVQARTPREAIAIAGRVSGLMRGAYHVSQGGTWTFTGRDGSAHKFGPSPLYLLREGRKHVQLGYVQHFEPRTLTLPKERPAKMALLLDKLTKEPGRGTALEVLAEALGLFAASGDELQVQHEFLGVWQALERLSMAEGGDTNRVATNIGNLWRNGSETVHYQMLAVAPIRNKLVHVGDYDIERQSVTFLLTGILRDALVQFAQLTDKLKTKQHFLDLYSMMTLSPQALRTKREAIRVVEWVRQI
ncbi:MAG: hypothetical protein JSS66_11035 [Armatimonadetes bacterium]|nr:hypothetical protein [Armatimonadota bacterium]